MTLSDLANLICSKIHKTDAVSLATCKKWLTYRMDMIWKNSLWQDSIAPVTVPMTSNLIILPYNIEAVLGVDYGSTNSFLECQDAISLIRLYPDIFTSSATVPRFFTPQRPSGLAVSPGSSTMQIRSSNPNDFGVVSIVGISGGLPVAELVTLVGTTLVTTVNAYDEVHELSKPTTNGVITVSTTAPGNAILQTLWANETERKHLRIWLNETPSDLTQSALIICKMRMPKFIDDSDGVPLPNAVEALVAFVTGDMLEVQRQYAKAQAKTQEGTAMVLTMIERERNQRANVTQIIPEPYQGGAWGAVANDWN